MLAGAAAQGVVDRLPTPLVIRIVATLRGQKLNAQFLSPSLLGRFTGQGEVVEVTQELVRSYDVNRLAFVLAHEVAHRLNRNGQSIHALMALRNVLCIGAALAPVVLLRRRRQVVNRRQTLSIMVIGVVLLAVVWTLSTVGLAAMSTRFEFAADRRGIELLVAAGWPPERAAGAFASFIGANGGRPADPWLWEQRHPSDADRERAALSLPSVQARAR